MAYDFKGHVLLSYSYCLYFRLHQDVEFCTPKRVHSLSPTKVEKPQISQLKSENDPFNPLSAALSEMSGIKNRWVVMLVRKFLVVSRWPNLSKIYFHSIKSRLKKVNYELMS